MTLEGHLQIEQSHKEVSFELIVRNPGPGTVELQFMRGQKAEFVIYENAEEIWRWSDGRMFTQALESDHLDPGEEVRYPSTWRDPTPGHYLVEAELTAANVRLTRSTELAI